MNEVITILEAEVSEDKWASLLDIFAKETGDIPPTIKQTFLVQSKSRPNIWRIMTHWRSQQDLDEMRATVDVPVAVKIFGQVDAKPKLEIWDSKIHNS